MLPGQRALRFPVQGSALHNAVMTGIDQSGNEVMWFRQLGSGEFEAVISPDRAVSPEVLAMIYAAAPWVAEYYFAEGGGGGG
jgi:hypothetical protein